MTTVVVIFILLSYKLRVYLNFLSDADTLHVLHNVHEWGGPVVFSHGRSNARGVAILLKRNSEFEVIQEISDGEGRMILIKVEKGKEFYIICNIYAPSHDHQPEQVELINLLEENITLMGCHSLVVGGDFNVVMDPLMDRNRPPSQVETKDSLGTRDRVRAFMDSFQLTDGWRYLHPTSRRYTFRRGAYGSRLDYLFLSDHLMDSDRLPQLPSLLSQIIP